MKNKVLKFLVLLLTVSLLCSCDVGLATGMNDTSDVAATERVEANFNADEQPSQAETERTEANFNADELPSQAVTDENSETGSEGKTADLTETEAETETPEVFMPDVEKNNYGLDFNIFIESSNNADYYYMDEKENSGSPMDEAVFARQYKVEKYLGVNIVSVAYENSTPTPFISTVRDAVASKNGSIDAIITHSNTYSSTLICEGLLSDLRSFEKIELDSKYWNKAFMDKLELNGNWFLGLSDYNILNTYVVAFNKDMLSLYESVLDKSIYQTVIDKEWTIDKMIDIASLVFFDITGDGKTDDDTYGITGTCTAPFSGFLTSSNIPMIDRSQSGSYGVAIGKNGRYYSGTEKLITKLKSLVALPSAYFNLPPDYNKVSVPLSSGRALMQLISTKDYEGIVNYNIDPGILPYPMYDLEQAAVGYKSLYWGGYIAAPSYQKNAKMTGETLELLSCYSDDVQKVYTEKLLGMYIADASDNAAMLDMIWDSLEADKGLAFSDVASSNVLYTVPELVSPSATETLKEYISHREGLICESLNQLTRKNNRT